MDIVKQLRDERYDVCDRNMRCNGEVMEEAADEIERLRKALQLIAAPSKVVVKGEEAVVALRLVLSSHRRTALKALGEK